MDQNQAFANLVVKILSIRPDAEALEGVGWDVEDLHAALSAGFADIDPDRVVEILRNQHASLLSRSDLVASIIEIVPDWQRVSPRPARASRTGRAPAVRRTTMTPANDTQLSLRLLPKSA